MGEAGGDRRFLNVEMRAIFAISSLWLNVAVGVRGFPFLLRKVPLLELSRTGHITGRVG